MKPGAPRALLCLLPGLGDALIASPIAGGLVDAGYSVDALTMLEPVAEYAGSLNDFQRVHNVPLLETGGAARFLFALRRERYDVLCVPAPAARWQYAAVACVIGARRAYIHRYEGLASAISGFGRMVQVPLLGGHRLAENRRMAEMMGLRIANWNYRIPASWRCNQRSTNVLGVHAGSMRYKGNEMKRWPLNNFAEVIRVQQQAGYRVRAFFGPNEGEEAHALLKIAPNVEVVQRSLAEAARAIDECCAFLANDSGLAHVAAGLGVPVVTIFGMTDPRRVAPIGPSIVVRPSSCPPCFDERMRAFECVRHIDYRCIRRDVSCDAVNRAVESAFATVPDVVAGS